MSGHGLPRSIPDVYARLDALEGGGASVEWDNIEDKPDFATVATSGDYGDLSNAPTLGTAAAANVGAAVPDVSDPPTQAEVNALLASLRTAGLIAT